MAKYRGRFVKDYESTLSWEWFTNPNTAHFWEYVRLVASPIDTTYRGIPVKRGELIRTLKQMSAETGLSEWSIRAAIKNLTKTGEIHSQATNKYHRIKVHNYAFFQDSDVAIHKQNASTPNDEPHNKPQDVIFINNRNEEMKNRRKREAQPPTLSEIKEFIEAEKLRIKPERFFGYYQERNWRGISNWKQKAREWDENEVQRPQAKEIRKVPVPDYMDPEKVREREEQERELKEWARQYREEQEKDADRIPDEA